MRFTGLARGPRTLRLSGVALAGLTALAACGQSASSGPSGSVNIALNTSLSGSFGFIGLANQNAMNLAVEQANASGGVNGKTINLQVKDDGGKADTGTELVRSEILNDKVVAVFGGVSSSVALAEQTVIAKYKIPFMLHTSNTDKLTVQKFNDYTFSVVPNTGMEGRANAIAAAKLPYTRYYLMGPDYEFGHSQLGAFKAKLKALKPDVQFVGEDYPKLGATDYSSYVSKIQAAKPEIVYSAQFAGDLITLLTQGKGVVLRGQEHGDDQLRQGLPGSLQRAPVGLGGDGLRRFHSVGDGRQKGRGLRRHQGLVGDERYDLRQHPRITHGPHAGSPGRLRGVRGSSCRQRHAGPRYFRPSDPGCHPRQGHHPDPRAGAGSTQRRLIKAALESGGLG